MKGTLQILVGTDEKKTLALEIGRYTIGRGSEAHIQIASQQISRRHAELIVEETGTTLLDCGSANGTAVNGKFVPTSLLRSGDRITIGDVVMEYRSVSEERPAPPSARPPAPAGRTYYASATRLVPERIRPKGLWPLFTTLFAVAFVGVALTAGVSYRSLLRERLLVEASGRASGLVRYLAEKNREELKLKNGLLLDVEAVSGEKGVREAFIVSDKKRVLAPISRLDQAVNDPFTAEALAQNSDRPISPGPRGPDGSRIFVHPIRTYDDNTGKYVVLGVAKILFSEEDALGDFAEADRLLYLLATVAVALAILFGWISARATALPLTRLAERIHRWRAGQIFEKEPPPFRDFQPLYEAVDQALEESQR